MKHPFNTGNRPGFDPRALPTKQETRLLPEMEKNYMFVIQLISFSLSLSKTHTHIHTHAHAHAHTHTHTHTHMKARLLLVHIL